MARLKGSDELYRLIHSLTKEEKGYFQKFAKRHTSSGNSYLRMFNEIAKQTAFEEADLKKKYKSFARMKVYLKDMIVESMLVYHRNNHPHMQLFNHIQKAHFLLGKGMYAESLTIVEESIKMCTKMELFPIERYLQRLRTELKAHKFNTIDDVSVMRDEYFDRVSALFKSDTNLLELEVKNFEWFISSKFGPITIFNGEKSMQILEEKLPVLSKRAEIKRAEVLNWYFAGYKDNDQVYSLTKRQADLSNKFKRENDSSVSIDNHILICIDTEKYDEALEYCQKLIQQRKALSLYHEIGFVWGVIRKSMVYIIMGNAPKAIEFLEDKESQLLQILNIKNQAPGVRAYRAYIITKLCALFINKRYREAWLFLNKHSSDLAQNKSNIPNIEMMQLLIQYEMGNYDLLQSMVRRAQTQVRKIEGDDSPLLHYLNFFKQASQYKGPNLGLIKKTISSMEKNAASKVTGCFGLLAYYDWLKSKAETE